MRRVLLPALAVLFLGGPPALAQDVGVSVGPDGLSIGRTDRYRHRYDYDRTGSIGCRTVTIRERNEDGDMITKRIERCR
jgi:hypothetical protein